MDAARTHSTHLRLSLLVLIALTLSAPVWAQSPSFQLSSTTVTCSSTFCANPPGGQVVVGSTGAAITYSATLTYDPNDSGNNGRWLVVNPNGGGLVTGTDNGGTLNFSLGSAQGLSQGSHQATVTLHATDGSGAADSTITITYQTGSGGGNGTLASTVNPINLNAAGLLANPANRDLHHQRQFHHDRRQHYHVELYRDQLADGEHQRE
jgi:hypothetical protein